jgi:hypothetical protein
MCDQRALYQSDEEVLDFCRHLEETSRLHSANKRRADWGDMERITIPARVGRMVWNNGSPRG